MGTRGDQCAHSVARGGWLLVHDSAGSRVDVCSHWCKDACLPAWPPPGRASCGVSVPIEDIWRYVQSVLNYRECGRGNAAADVLTSELCGFIPTPAQVHSVELSHS